MVSASNDQLLGKTGRTAGSLLQTRMTYGRPRLLSEVMVVARSAEAANNDAIDAEAIC